MLLGFPELREQVHQVPLEPAERKPEKLGLRVGGVPKSEASCLLISEALGCTKKNNEMLCGSRVSGLKKSWAWVFTAFQYGTKLLSETTTHALISKGTLWFHVQVYR